MEKDPKQTATDLQEVVINLLAFADDTIAVSPLDKTEETNAIVDSVFKERQERIHPDKTEYMAAGKHGTSQSLDPRATEHVRVLGPSSTWMGEPEQTPTSA